MNGRLGGLTLALVIAMAPFAAAQTSAPPPAAPADQPPPQSQHPLQALTVNFALETYYQYNWNRPAGRINALRAYDTRANSFSIQQAALVVESAPISRGRAVVRPPARSAVRAGDGGVTGLGR
jgi:hypothetical protein